MIISLLHRYKHFDPCMHLCVSAPIPFDAVVNRDKAACPKSYRTVGPVWWRSIMMCLSTVYAIGPLSEPANVAVAVAIAIVVAVAADRCYDVVTRTSLWLHIDLIGFTAWKRTTGTGRVKRVCCDSLSVTWFFLKNERSSWRSTSAEKGGLHAAGDQPTRRTKLPSCQTETDPYKRACSPPYLAVPSFCIPIRNTTRGLLPNGPCYREAPELEVLVESETCFHVQSCTSLGAMLGGVGGSPRNCVDFSHNTIAHVTIQTLWQHNSDKPMIQYGKSIRKAQHHNGCRYDMMM